MIKSLVLKNFRSWRNVKIVFHKGVNAIVGEGMAGKTNIIRSIEMLRRLRPFNRWKSNFAGKDEKTVIQLKSTDQKLIRLTRINSDTEYIVKDLEKHKIWKFRKLNRKVPNKVYNDLAIRAINIQKQLDPPYMVLDSPPQVTKEINQITNINMVDNWISDVNSSLKDSEYVLKTLLSEKIKIEAALDKLQDLDKIDETIHKLGVVERRKTVLDKKVYLIETTMANIIASERKTARLEKALRATKIVKKLEKIDKRITALENDKKEIEEFIKSSVNVSKLKNTFIKLVNSFFEALEKNKRCPICLSEVKQTTIKRLKNELYSNV